MLLIIICVWVCASQPHPSFAAKSQAYRSAGTGQGLRRPLCHDWLKPLSRPIFWGSAPVVIPRHLVYTPFPEHILSHVPPFAGNALPTWMSDDVLPEGNFSAIRFMAFPGPWIQSGPFMSFKKHLVCFVCQALSALASNIHHSLSHPISLVSSSLLDGTILQGSDCFSFCPSSALPAPCSWHFDGDKCAR